jgi:hypothetical protein
LSDQKNIPEEERQGFLSQDFLQKKIPAIPAIELSERTPQIDKQAFVPGHD